jgi:putative transposase
VGQTIAVRGLPIQPAIMFYRRRLPHWIPENSILFLTWRLAGSMPVRAWPAGPNGRSPSGPLRLQDARIANIVASALRYGEAARGLYHLYAWVIMPNHVHAILQPRIELPIAMQWLKGRTARAANRMLGRTGKPFWQDESFDHWVRSDYELHHLIAYVESNPVRAGLVTVAAQWPWSSAQLQADDATDRLLHLRR